LANVDISWQRYYPKFKEAIDTRSEWRGTVFQWNGQGKPPTNFWQGDYSNPNALAEINLGSSINNGLMFNAGNGSLRDSKLPSDNFAIRAYTEKYLEAGSTYKFTVYSSDDGYQLFASFNGQAKAITPLDAWQDNANSNRDYEFKPTESGNYAIHVHYFDATGNANFNMGWSKVTSTGLPTSAGAARYL